MLLGIDTSVYQGEVNWTEAKAAGVQMGFPKATEATGFEDPQFVDSWPALAALGLPRIAYHFFHDSESGASQCDYMHGYVRACGRFAWGDMGALDVEEVGVTEADRATREVIAFIRHFWQTVAKPLVIYTNYDTCVNRMGNPTSKEIEACPLWLADLGSYGALPRPWPTGPAFEQWSWHGRIAGVNGEVDLDRFRGTRAQLDKIRHTMPRIP